MKIRTETLEILAKIKKTEQKAFYKTLQEINGLSDEEIKEIKKLVQMHRKIINKKKLASCRYWQGVFIKGYFMDELDKLNEKEKQKLLELYEELEEFGGHIATLIKNVENLFKELSKEAKECVSFIGVLDMYGEPKVIGSYGSEFALRKTMDTLPKRMKEEVFNS